MTASGRRLPRLPVPTGRGIAELRMLATRSREVVVASAVVGLVVGLGVLAFERIGVDVLFAAVLEAPAWVQVLAPGIGLVVSALALRYLADGASPATTDVYIQAMPDPRGPFPLRPFGGRLAASLATLGAGGSAGYEGPSIYLGAGVGAFVHERFGGRFGGLDRHVLLAAGAAAGVAAIFKAPATGAVFALEVPFQDDLAQGALLPALVGSATGYLAYAAVDGTSPLIPIDGTPPLDLRDLVAAVAVGVLCGLGARAYAALVGLAKSAQQRMPTWTRVVGAGAILGLLVVLSRLALGGEPLSLGPGYTSIEWALDPHRGLWLLVLLATIRAVGTVVTLGGGVGGLFVPLVVQGAISGRIISGIVGGEHQSLFVVVGIAAFLGAGYRVPLAAVMFVAEATGRPGYVVPGLLAAVVAQLLMGDESVSPYQRRRSAGHVEARADLPVLQALVTDTATAPPSTTLTEFVTEHVAAARRRAVPVIDADGAFVGLATLEAILDVEPESWPTTRLAEVVGDERQARGGPDWTLGEALAAMVAADTDHLPIVGDDGRFLGLVTRASILDLQELLDRLAAGPT